MGLDGVELVMAWEETFGITISDAEAEKILTPRQAVDCIFGKLEQRTGPAECLSQRAFHGVRRSIMKEFSISRREIRLDTKLARLIPLQGRSRHWNNLRNQIGVASMPNLERPGLFLLFWATLSIFTSSVAAYFLLPNAAPPWVSTLFSMIAFVGLCFVGAWISRPIRVCFGYSCSKVSDLVRYVVTTSPEQFQGRDKGWAREEVTMLVRQSIVEQLGITDFTDDSEFVRDMGLS